MRLIISICIIFFLLSCDQSRPTSSKKKQASWTLKSGEKISGKIIRYNGNNITITSADSKKTIALSELEQNSYLRAEAHILFKAVDNDDTASIKAAIERNAPLDLKDKYGDSLLHKASEAKSYKTAALIIKAKPETLKILNDDGLNAYDVFSLEYSDWKYSLTKIQRQNYKKQPDYRVYSSMGRLFAKHKPNHTKAFKEILAQRKKDFYAQKKSIKESAKNTHLKEYISEPLYYADGDRFNTRQLNEKYTAFYFSAKWCPPCRAFTPKLVNFRNKHSDKFEVIFVSSDKSSGAQTDYMNSYNMPWPATQWRGTDSSNLSRKFGIRGIPALVVINSKGEVVSRRGTNDLYQTRFSSIPSGWR